MVIDHKEISVRVTHATTKVAGTVCRNIDYDV